MRDEQIANRNEWAGWRPKLGLSRSAVNSLLALVRQSHHSIGNIREQGGRSNKSVTISFHCHFAQTFNLH